LADCVKSCLPFDGWRIQIGDERRSIEAMTDYLIVLSDSVQLSFGVAA